MSASSAAASPGAGPPRRPRRPPPLTVSDIDPAGQSQLEIDAAVKSSASAGGASLYRLDGPALVAARPDVVLTQSLCSVCAVAADDVSKEICEFRPDQKCRVVSLEPRTLEEVATSFVTVAEACGVRERGLRLASKFWEDISRVSDIAAAAGSRPRVLYLEWLDPPYDAGHWIPEMFGHSGCTSALNADRKATEKSVQLTWDDIYESDPDVVVVGCCGFDTERNARDAVAARDRLERLRAFRTGRVYATDGNLYFARPGPGLREGVAILARCVHDGDDAVVRRLQSLPFMPEENSKAWHKVDFSAADSSATIPDVEDLATEYAALHEEAVSAGREFYADPPTGYLVMTEVAHKKRGRCCGSGCRHCPYDHVNVTDKSARIQNPAFLYDGVAEGAEDGGAPLKRGGAVFGSVSSIPPGSHVKVLFFSGGKDSFLALRRLVRQRLAPSSHEFHVVLLTTFDAGSRTVAHQDVPIATVERQARHLGVPLVAVPLRRGSGEAYLDRIKSGVGLIRRRVPAIERITLVFGDLHLDHIREWRDAEMSPGYELEYPLWKAPYDGLTDDLEASRIRTVVSAATVDGVEVGAVYNRALRARVEALGMDGFGEQGEFHSVAEVWAVSREQALGL